jgi:hypothetical protein
MNQAKFTLSAEVEGLKQEVRARIGAICLLKVQICQRNRRRGGNVGKNEVVSTFPWVWDLSGNNTFDGIDLGNPIITTGEKMRHSKLVEMNLIKRFRLSGMTEN